MVGYWQALGAQIKLLRECVSPITEKITPSDYPDEEFTLMKVTYEGKCQVERTPYGKNIRAKNRELYTILAKRP